MHPGYAVSQGMVATTLEENRRPPSKKYDVGRKCITRVTFILACLLTYRTPTYLATYYLRLLADMAYKPPLKPPQQKSRQAGEQELVSE